MVSPPERSTGTHCLFVKYTCRMLKHAVSLQNDDKHDQTLTRVDGVATPYTSTSCATSVCAVAVSFRYPSYSSCPSSHTATRNANALEDRNTTCPATLRCDWIRHAARTWCEWNKSSEGSWTRTSLYVMYQMKHIRDPYAGLTERCRFSEAGHNAAGNRRRQFSPGAISMSPRIWRQRRMWRPHLLLVRLPTGKG